MWPSVLFTWLHIQNWQLLLELSYYNLIQVCAFLFDYFVIIYLAPWRFSTVHTLHLPLGFGTITPTTKFNELQWKLKKNSFTGYNQTHFRGNEDFVDTVLRKKKIESLLLLRRWIDLFYTCLVCLLELLTLPVAPWNISAGKITSFSWVFKSSLHF